MQRRPRQERAGPQDGPDAEWLAHLLECGLLAGSFISPAQIKAARDVLRYRGKVAQQRVSEIARLGNVLQDAGIKIDSVASSIATKFGRARIEAQAAVISEIGADVREFFLDAARLASWTGLCPGNHESAGESFMRGQRGDRDDSHALTRAEEPFR